jgi:hypothetical protein
MPHSRYEPRRSWHNTRLVLWAVPVVFLSLVLYFAITGRSWPLIAFGVLVLVALVLALYRDRGRTCRYAMENEVLVLVNAGGTKRLPASSIIDASLIDRAGARGYIQGKTRHMVPDQRVAMVRAFTAYCSVDIGLTTFTFGLGRGLIDRMPAGRSDLVLVRTRDGEDLLLSPQYPQDMVDGINRALLAEMERGQR